MIRDAMRRKKSTHRDELPTAICLDKFDDTIKDFSTESLNRVKVETTLDLQLRGKIHE